MTSKNSKNISEELALPAVKETPEVTKVVRIKTASKKSATKPLAKPTIRRRKLSADRPTAAADRKPKPVSDALFLDTVRDSVFNKLKSGDLTLSLGDGFKAIDLKNKISTAEPDNRLNSLLEELRQELMKTK